MKLFNFATTILVFVSLSVPSLAGDLTIVYGQRFADRNCVWCHGPSLQGFSTAPRLAGQSSQYVMNQLYSFRDHARDNPLSRQYMWGAAANHLGLQTARNLALYLSTISPKSANDGYDVLTARGRTIYEGGIPDANIPSCVACHGPNAEGAAAQWTNPPFGRAVILLLEKATRAVGRGIPRDRLASYARNREQAIRKRN
jgi:cytochrome c553